MAMGGVGVSSEVAPPSDMETIYQGGDPFMERMKAMIKEPDNSQRDAMIKQLQAERDRQVGPQDSYGQLMEYLGQIAATPRGMSSFGAGAAGVRGVNALEEQRAQKRFELGSKIIEQEQGKINDSRAFAKDMFNVGEKEYDQILKTQFEAAKQITSNEMEALKIAKQETLKIMEMRQNAQIENRRIDAQATSASERLEDRRQQRMQQNAQFLDKMEATWASTYAKDPVYKGLSDQRKLIEMQRSIEKDEKKLSNLDAKLDDVNTKMIERGNSLRGGGGGSTAKIMSRADVAATAASSGKTEQQVIEAAKGRGYTIQ